MKSVKNVLSSFAYERLLSYYYADNCMWAYRRTATSDRLDAFEPILSHNIMTEDGVVHNQFLSEQCMHILGRCLEETGHHMLKLLQSRTFMSLPFKNVSGYTPHKDYDHAHEVCLYYVTSCDEDDEDAKTVFFDDSGNVVYKHTPKANELIAFDGSTLHASGFPSRGERIVINMDYVRAI